MLGQTLPMFDPTEIRTDSTMTTSLIFIPPKTFLFTGTRLTSTNLCLIDLQVSCQQHESLGYTKNGQILYCIRTIQTQVRMINLQKNS